MKVFLFSFFFSLNLLAADEILFVQSVKAKIKSNPKMDSTDIAELHRGDQLQVLKIEGNWIQIKFSGKVDGKASEQTGWISKLFTSKNKPIGSAEILTSGKEETPAQVSRKRSSDYSVSAATRGLTASERVRNGDALYRSDKKAVEKIENRKMTDEELDKFKKDGNLEN